MLVFFIWLMNIHEAFFSIFFLKFDDITFLFEHVKTLSRFAESEEKDYSLKQLLIHHERLILVAHIPRIEIFCTEPKIDKEKHSDIIDLI